MTVARASTFLFPWTSSFLSWLMAWFFFSDCSLLWFCLAVTVPSAAATAPAAQGFDAFCRRDPVLGLDLDPVLALNPGLETPVVPDAVLVASVAGAGRTGVTGALAFTTSGA